MKKQIIILTVTSLVLVSPIFAAKDNLHSQGDEHKLENQHVLSTTTIAPEPTSSPSDLPSGTPTPTVSPTEKPSSTPTSSCDPNSNWKNHGEYVSCVARTHQGGEVTSEAARSEIGKKQHEPSGTPSATPTASSSATPTPSPVSGPISEGQNGFSLDNFGKGFQHFMNSLINFLGFHHNHD